MAEVNGAAAQIDRPDSLADVVASLGTREGKGVHRSWFTRLVTGYLHYRKAHRHAHLILVEGASQQASAEALVRRACVLAATTGAGSGALTTGAALLVASTPQPLGIAITLPAAAAGITIEMLGRTLIHLDMTFDICAVFGIHFDPDDAADFWQLYGLAFGAQKHDDEEDPGSSLVHEVAHAEQHAIGEEIGDKLLGESVLKNLVPFLGIATSAYSNWRRTKQLGDTVRRWARYTRALDDSLASDKKLCAQSLELLIEGFWFIFTADGTLSPEETALLASFVRDLPTSERAATQARMTKDESDWLERLRDVPADIRGPYLHALEVAAAVDKSVTLPEHKLLVRAARALQLEFDPDRVAQMMKTFASDGVLARDAKGHWLRDAHH